MKSNMSVYCVHPISGCSADEVFTYYDEIKGLLDPYYRVLTPMYGKGELRTELEFKASGYEDDPLANNHSIFERDRWMVEQSDIILANLTGATRASIGSMFELAWASILGKYVVVVMEKQNVHRHAFVLQAADVIFEDAETAVEYLKRLSLGEF